MAPAAVSGNWTDAKTLKFVMLIAYALGGSPAEHWAEIADKMGPEYTATALQSKWQRLRAQVAKDGGVGEGGAITGTPAKGKKADTPKKTAAVKEDGRETPKSGRKRKADSAAPDVTPGKKVKEEVSEEPEDYIKGEPEVEADEI